MTVRATRYVTYQTPLEVFEYAIHLINKEMREGRLDWKETGWVDSFKMAIDLGHCPSPGIIDEMNKVLTKINAPYPLTLPEKSKLLTR